MHSSMLHDSVSALAGLRNVLEEHGRALATAAAIGVGIGAAAFALPGPDASLVDFLDQIASAVALAGLY